MTDKEDRLPAWARSELHALRVDRDRLKAQLDAAVGEADKVNHRTPIGVRLQDNAPAPLPFDRIDFPAFYVQVRVGQYNRLYITSRSGTLRIEPQASNSIAVMGGVHDHESMAPEACAT